MAFSFIMQFGQGIKQQNLEGLGGNFHKEWRIVVTKPRKLWRKYFEITVAHTYEDVTPSNGIRCAVKRQRSA